MPDDQQTDEILLRIEQGLKTLNNNLGRLFTRGLPRRLDEDEDHETVWVDSDGNETNHGDEDWDDWGEDQEGDPNEPDHEPVKRSGFQVPRHIRLTQGIECSERCPYYDGKRCSWTGFRAPCYSHLGPCPIVASWMAVHLGVCCAEDLRRLHYLDYEDPPEEDE